MWIAAVGPTSRPKALLVPARGGDLQAEDPHDRRSEDPLVRTGVAGDHVGDMPPLPIRRVRERDERLRAVEPVVLLDRVPHSIDVRVARPERLVDSDAAPGADGQSRVGGEARLRSHADGGDDDVRG